MMVAHKRKSGRPTLLTRKVQRIIVAAIQRGAFDWVAAQAAGIDRATFYEWMARGEGRDPNRPSTREFADFADKVRAARAKARSGAEIKVRKVNPLAWLRYGPGRDRPDEPGWTDSSEISGTLNATVTVKDMEMIRQKRWDRAAKAIADADDRGHPSAGSGQA